MVFEKDIKRILEKYERRVITKELIGQIISDYKKLFICHEDVEKYYKE